MTSSSRRTGAASSSVLSSDQVAALLKLVREHEELLNQAHNDAKRLLHTNLRPAYVIDFQMLFWYMFDVEENAERVVEIEYLFDCDELEFIIGPGTLIEIIKFLYAVAEDVLDASILEAVGDRMAAPSGLRYLLRQLPKQVDTIRKNQPEVLFALSRLKTVLDRKNVKHYSEVIAHLQDPRPDAEALSAVKSALDAERPNRHPQNAADALNFAAVVTMRKAANLGEIEFFPYLLTATQPLLNETRWGFDSIEEWGLSTTVSRQPVSAIYSRILLAAHPDASLAVDHSDEMAFEASKLLHLLRRTPSYRVRRLAATLSTEVWDYPLLRQHFTTETRRMFVTMSRFFSDPVVREAQRITDNVEHSVANWARQRGEILEEMSPPRRLFDLIATLVRALDDSRYGGHGAVGDLWESVITQVTHRSDDAIVTIFEDLAADGPAAEYLRVEHHHSNAGPYHAVSWPCHVGVDSIVRVFSDAFRRHGLPNVEAVLGTRDGTVLRFDVELPVGIAELSDALANGAPATWIRFRGGVFDLYCDVAAPVKTNPVVGVIGSQLDVEHMVGLYHSTSARFVFPSWLNTIMHRGLSAKHQE